MCLTYSIYLLPVYFSSFCLFTLHFIWKYKYLKDVDVFRAVITYEKGKRYLGSASDQWIVSNFLREMSVFLSLSQVRKQWPLLVQLPEQISSLYCFIGLCCTSTQLNYAWIPFTLGSALWILVNWLEYLLHVCLKPKPVDSFVYFEWFSRRI